MNSDIGATYALIVTDGQPLTADSLEAPDLKEVTVLTFSSSIPVCFGLSIAKADLRMRAGGVHD